MSEVDRRTFLTRSSLLVAGVGAITAVPSVLTALIPEAPEADAAVSDAAALEADDAAVASSAPLVAHVRDLSTGEISIFNGTKEVVVQNMSLARTILRASH